MHITKLERKKLIERLCGTQEAKERIADQLEALSGEDTHTCVSVLLEVRAEIQRETREFVQREIGHCVSYMVNSVLMADVLSALNSYDLLDFDDGVDIRHRQPTLGDYRDKAPDDLKVVQEETTTGDYIWVWTHNEDNDWCFKKELEAYQDAFETLNLDGPEGSEVFEHWIVSDWLADKLDGAREVITKDFLGLTIWGRCTTGQAIEMDEVIQRIYEEVQCS